MHELLLFALESTDNPQRGLDPNIVRPGYVALGLVALLGVALVFLARSFAGQARKARQTWPEAAETDAELQATGSGSDPQS